MIIVGSGNQIKVSAVKDTLAGFTEFMNTPIQGIAVPSGISEQPLTLSETIKGAKIRAKNAFQNCELSFGIEDGMMRIPETGGESMIVSVCSIYDGNRHHIGLSSGFRLPMSVANLVTENKLDLNQAMYSCGLTKNPKIGAAEGAIGFFTNGRLLRKEFCQQAVLTALISIENPLRFAPVS